MITHESSLENFTEQFDFVLKNYTKHGSSIGDYDHILLGGLGGSGIGALIAKNWFYDKAVCPIETIADYHLPKYAGERSFVVLNSYSGNTEETLSLYKEAKEAGCTVVIITSGGQLMELAHSDNRVLYTLPTGYQPRMTIGLGLSFICMIVSEVLGEDYTDVLTDIRNGFAENKEHQKNSALQIFNFFERSMENKFVLVTDREFGPVATRFTQQLNENSKLEGFVNILPESNHNVIESYIDRLPTNFILLYSNSNDRVTSRFDFLMSHLELENNRVLPLSIPEFSLYTLFDMIYRLDWVSVHFANERGANLMEVPIITSLKDYLNDCD